MALHLLANRRQIDLEAMWIPRNLPQIFRIKDLITASDKDGTTSLPPSPYYEPLLLFSFLGVWNITVFRLNNKKKMGMAVTKKIPPLNIVMLLFIVVRLLSQVQPSATTWTAVCHLPEFAQTYVHWVRDAIQPSHPLSPPSPPAFNLS